MSFQLSNSVDPDKVFLVKRSEVEGRFDPSFYTPEKQEFFKKLLQNKHVKKLKNLIKEGSYGILPPGDSYDSELPVTFIRATDLKPDLFLDESKAYKIDASYLTYRRSIIKDHDLLLAVKGATIASKKCVAYIPVATKDSLINGSIFRFQVINQAKPKYVAYMIDSSLSKRQMKYNLVANNAVDYLDRALINNLLLFLPSESEQDKIVVKMDAAYKAKKQKEAQAQALLDEIDDYLLGELGITLPEEEKNTTASRIFTRKLSELSGGRFDSIFFKPIFFHTITAIRRISHEHLGSFVNFSNETWDQKSYFEKTFPYIEISQIDLHTGEIRKVKNCTIEEAPSRAKLIVRNEDILISTTRPSRGAITLIKSDERDISIASTGFAIIRGIDPRFISIEYLFFILRFKLTLKQMEQRSSGGNYPAITQEELAKILIPLPPLEIQNKIAEHISQIREQAKQLQAEAKADLEQAKAEVEKMILGEN